MQAVIERRAGGDAKFWVSALVLCFLAGTAAQRALPEVLRQPDTYGALDVFEDKPAASVVGGFRTSLASFLFLKSDEYLHGGVVMRPATEPELARGVRLASHGDEMKEHHSIETTGVPEAERDSRGLWGEVERNVQPFMDIRHHGHRDASEALPLFRMMAWADPHFVEAYSTGAYLVFCGVKKDNVHKALEFLDEGIKNNPRSYVLRNDAGTYNLYNLKNNAAARDHFLAAVQLLEKTPPEKVDEEKAEQAWTGLIAALRRLGDTPNEIKWARRGLEKYPLNPTCRTTFRKHNIPLPSKRKS